MRDPQSAAHNKRKRGWLPTRALPSTACHRDNPTLIRVPGSSGLAGANKMRFDRTRPRALETSTPLAWPWPPARPHAPGAPGRSKALRAGLGRIQDEAAAPAGAPPRAHSAWGLPPEPPGSSSGKVTSLGEAGAFTTSLVLLAGKPAARRGRRHGGSGFKRGTACPDKRPRLPAKEHPAAGASAAAAHLQHTPPQLFAALPKDFQVVRRQKGCKGRKKSSLEDTFNSLSSVPCSPLAPPARGSWESRGGCGNGPRPL